LKADRCAKDLFKQLDNYNFSNGNGNEYDDDYYLEIGSEPPRFADYRAARAKITDAFGNKTCEDVWDSITQDELDYYLFCRDPSIAISVVNHENPYEMIIIKGKVQITL
jgi:hypothetical protein